MMGQSTRIQYHVDDKLFQSERGKEVVIARHTDRPHTLDYCELVFDWYFELHGDRIDGDSTAMVAGIAALEDMPVAFVGQQKGEPFWRDMEYRNRGQSSSNGYRKAVRIMEFSAMLRNPSICFIDTPAAECNVAAEAAGISNAISQSMVAMTKILSPIVAVVIGEGGSGGAIGLSVADKILMMRHSIFSVIPPESCAAIIWRDVEKRTEAAEALQLTAQDALDRGLIDGIIEEPVGGAHLGREQAAANVKEALLMHLGELRQLDEKELLRKREEKFLKIGSFNE
jgi:acetyl-CoA carboxylase carboxyl transferase subunit alpha